MNQRPAHYPDHERTMTGDTLHGLFMGRVISVDPATYTAKVEIEDGSVTIQTTVMTLRAHDTRGWTWLPEEGELVVVAFLGGAKTRPVILGSMFDSRDGLPNTEEGSVTLAHKSGTTLKIDADGDVHLTHPTGHTVNLDATKVELTHQGGQKITLTGTKVELDSANGVGKVTVDNTVTKLESNGNKVELTSAGTINIFPSPSGLVNLGDFGIEFAARGGDVTSSPIGPVPDHFHTIIAGGTKVVIGG
jgi:phage baseplate assembly protein V